MLTVTDSMGLTAISITNVTVRNIITENQAPVANAGQNQIVDEGGAVNLIGSGSDNEDGSNVSYHWQQTEGASVALQNSTSAQASFTAPLVEGSSILTFLLTVTDSKGLTAFAMTNVTITDVITINQPPVADAGNTQTLVEGEQGSINGSGSFDVEDGSLLSYHWSQLSGTPVLLSSTMDTSATFTIPEIITPTEIMTFQLLVTDSSGQSNNTGTDIVQLTIIKKNAEFFQQLSELSAVIFNTSARSPYFCESSFWASLPKFAAKA